MTTTTGNNNGRKSGKFAAGNTAAAGHGRPPRAIEEDYLRRLRVIVTPERWDKIITEVVERAEAGERWAVEFLATRLLGAASLNIKQEITSAVEPFTGFDYKKLIAGVG